MSETEKKFFKDWEKSKYEKLIVYSTKDNDRPVEVINIFIELIDLDTIDYYITGIFTDKEHDEAVRISIKNCSLFEGGNPINPKGIKRLAKKYNLRMYT